MPRSRRTTPPNSTSLGPPKGPRTALILSVTGLRDLGIGQCSLRTSLCVGLTPSNTNTERARPGLRLELLRTCNGCLYRKRFSLHADSREEAEIILHANVERALRRLEQGDIRAQPTSNEVRIEADLESLVLLADIGLIEAIARWF
ncbi:hypothetical protein PSPO01_12824 [Paraphaeosphaeria sporulosa]